MTKVGDLELLFPNFLDLKLINIQPDITDVTDLNEKPVFDVIAGVDSMDKLGISIDSSKNVSIIDHIEYPIRPLDSL